MNPYCIELEDESYSNKSGLSNETSSLSRLADSVKVFSKRRPAKNRRKRSKASQQSEVSVMSSGGSIKRGRGRVLGSSIK
jgi:hypothetical protein